MSNLPTPTAPWTVFALTSRSETQGMVLTEAMAAGVPVVAFDAPGGRETVKDARNGRLLRDGTTEALVTALQWMADLSPAKMQDLKNCAADTTEEFSMQRSATKALGCYEQLRGRAVASPPQGYAQLARLLRLIAAEWDILQGMVSAAGAALSRPEPSDGCP